MADAGDLEQRVAKLERVLGLQRLTAEDEGDTQLAGLSTQSNHCGGSALSVVCVAPDDVAARVQQ